MEELIGTIKLFAGNFAPHGWLICDGRLLNITQNAALFSIIGTHSYRTNPFVWFI